MRFRLALFCVLALATMSFAQEGGFRAKKDVTPTAVPFATCAEVEAWAAQRSSIDSILKMYKELLAHPDFPEAEKELARAKVKRWRDLRGQGARRVGSEWLTQSEIDEKLDQEETALAEAWRIADLGDDKLAVEKFSAATRINPSGIRASFTLGLYYAIKARQLKEAHKHFADCVTRLRRLESPASEDRANLIASLNNLALVEIRQKTFDKALGKWNEALAVGPPPADLIQNVGRLSHLAANATGLGIPKTSAKAASKLYAKCSKNAENKFESETGWLYMELAPHEKAKIVAAGSHYGSGFVVQPLYVVTNFHLLAGVDKAMVSVGTNPETKLPAHVVAESRLSDLALLHVKGLTSPPMALRREPPKPATPIIVLGYPGGPVLGSGIKATQGGVVNLPERALDGLLFVDAQASSGSSGSPICDQSGAVVAIAKSLVTPPGATKGTLLGGIPTNRIEEFVKENLRVYKPVDANPDLRKWSEIAETARASAVSIEVRDERTELAKSPPQQGRYEDPWCMFCNGFGKVDCPNCNRGRVASSAAELTGVNPVTGDKFIGITPTEAICEACRGAGVVPCSNCKNGLDQTVKAGQRQPAKPRSSPGLSGALPPS